jgi:hypothetical protein
MMSMIPTSVRMRARGYVFNPHTKFMTTPWVHAIEIAEKTRAFNKRVNDTVDILAKFAIIASRQFRANKVYTTKMLEYYRKKAANPRQFKHGEMSWADIMEIEDQKAAAETIRIREAYIARLVSMSEPEIIRYHQLTMAEHRRHHEDYRPWMDFITMIHQRRRANRVAVVEHAQVWTEINRPRRPNSGAFGALADSDDE